jgi:hypothetical protein
MNQQNTIPIKFDITVNNLEVLTNDLKRINEGLEKGCKGGIYGLKESQLLCTSMENFTSIILQITQSAQQTFSKVENLEKEKNTKEDIE